MSSHKLKKAPPTPTKLASRAQHEKVVDHRWHIAEVLGLWAAAAVGVAAIIISSRDADQGREKMVQQLEVMKRQLDESKRQREQNAAQVRARIALTEAVVQSEGRNGVGATTFRYKILNTGSTDALSVKINGNMEFAPVPVGTVTDHKTGCTRAPHNNLEKPAEFGVIRPDGTVDLKIIGEAAQKIRDTMTTEFAFVHVKVEYNDIFYPETPRHFFEWCDRVFVPDYVDEDNKISLTDRTETRD